MLNIKRVPVGILQVNCYILWCDGRADALVIDPGDESDKIIRAIDELGLKPRGILLTHAHVDHIRGVSDVAAKYGIAVWCHDAEKPLYRSPDNALLPWIPAAVDLPEIAAAPATLPGAEYTVLFTPGHTRGGVCYYFEDAGELFSGDTLFRGTHGRTDFAGGSETALFASIREKLFTLPDDVKVHPGHQEMTTIGAEKAAQRDILFGDI